MFSAILKYGWNNIRHYLIMDGLSKEEALLYEAAFIRGWRTCERRYGYNERYIEINGIDDIAVPRLVDCKKEKIEDTYEDDTTELYDYALRTRRCRKVRCIETGEIFASAADASTLCGTGKAGAIYSAIRTGGASGKCLIPDENGFAFWPAPAHWEYVDE